MYMNSPQPTKHYAHMQLLNIEQYQRFHKREFGTRNKEVLDKDDLYGSAALQAREVRGYLSTMKHCVDGMYSEIISRTLDADGRYAF